MLPDEIYAQIFTQCTTANDIKSLMLTCTQWRQIVCNMLTILPHGSGLFPKCFPNITTIDHEHNKYQIDSTTLLGLTRLQILYAHKCMNVCAGILSQLTTLRSLTVDCHKFTLQSVGTLTSLTRLRIRKNPQETLSLLSKLTNLTSLVPPYGRKEDCIPIFPKLQYLYLWGDINCVRNDQLSQMTTLTYLDLDRNTAIQDSSLRCLTMLTHLDLSRNYVITNESISCLTNLTNLIVGVETQITVECLSQLPKLDLVTLNCPNDRYHEHPISKFPRLKINVSWYA